MSGEEMEILGDLISWAVNGPEHGVITYDQWAEKCRELKTFLLERGYKIHGQWTTV